MYRVYLFAVLAVFLPGCFPLMLNATVQACVSKGCDKVGTVRCQQNDTTGLYSCICFSGHTNPMCEDRDECGIRDNICETGICVNTIGSFRCDCLPGMTGSRCKDIDTSNKCPLGYRDDGGNCTDINECTFSSISPCKRGACTNTVGSYVCACPAGWTDQRCNSDINECGSSPCHNGNCTDLVDSFVCSCYPYWTGTLCDVPLTTTVLIIPTTSAPTPTLTPSTAATSSQTTPSVSTKTSQSHQTPLTLAQSSQLTTASASTTPMTMIPSTASATLAVSAMTTPVQTTRVSLPPSTIQTHSPTTTKKTELPEKPTQSPQPTIRGPEELMQASPDDSVDPGLIAGCVIGGVAAIGVGLAITIALYQCLIRRRKLTVYPEQDTVIEVEQNASSSGSEAQGSKPGHSVVGIPIEAGTNRDYAMRTRFVIQRMFRQ